MGVDYTRAVTITKTENRGFKVKPNRNRTAVFWRPYDGFSRIKKMVYSYVILTANVLNCHLPTTRHINYIGLSWRSSLITLLCLQLMVCFTHISCKNWNQEKPKPRFSVNNRPKPNRKWNSRTITAIDYTTLKKWRPLWSIMWFKCKCKCRFI